MPIERGRPVRSVIKWIFEPFLPAIYGIRTRQIPPFIARMFTESIAHETSPARPGAEFVQHQAVELAPDAGPLTR